MVMNRVLSPRDDRRADPDRAMVRTTTRSGDTGPDRFERSAMTDRD
jgi:hypothetical protein